METIPLQRPWTEGDFRDISRLPDSVKELRSFDGSPTQYLSRIYSVEMILKDFEIVKQKPIYRAIVQSIRKKVLSMCSHPYYGLWMTAAKSNNSISSLCWMQECLKMDELSASVNHHLLLIINKLKTEVYCQEIVRALIVILQKPKILPLSYLEL